MPLIARGSRFLFWLISALVVVLVSWISFSKFVVPAIIESAYRGESLPIFNSIISGQEIHPVQKYLSTWEFVSWRVTGMLIVFALMPLPLVTTWIPDQNCMTIRSKRMLALRRLPTNTSLALFGFVIVFYLYYLQPVGYVYFIAEDYWAEYGSFASWGMATCFLAWMLFRERSARRPGFCLFAVGAFFVAAEEISWGQRVLDISSPTLFTKYNLQWETNLHNLVSMRSELYVAVGVAVSLWSILLPMLIGKWGRLGEWSDKLGIPIVPMYL